LVWIINHEEHEAHEDENILYLSLVNFVVKIKRFSKA